MKDIDRTLALVGMLVSSLLLALLFLLGIQQPAGLFITLYLTFTYYYIMRDRLLQINTADHGRPPSLLASRPGFLVWVSVLVCGLGCLIVFSSRNILTRPIWVFGLIAVIALIILLEIVLKAYAFPGGGPSILIQIVILLVSIVLSGLISIPFNGGDTWAHLYNANIVFEHGSLNAIEGSYQNYPLYPALIYFLSEMVNLASGQAARLISILSVIGCTLFIYLLGRRNFNSTQKGLLAILLLVGSKWFIYWGTLAVSMTISIFLFTVFYALISLRLIKIEKYPTVFLYTIAIVLPFYHPAGAVAIIIVCLVYWLLGILVFRRTSLIKIKSSMILFLVLFSIIVTLTQWMYFGQTLEFAVRSLLGAVFQDTPSSISIGKSASDPITYTLDNLNFFLLLCVSSIEVLRQIKLKTDLVSLYSGISGFFLIVFAYSTQLINLQAALPYRWLLFGTIMLIVPATNIFANMLKARSFLGKAFAISAFLVFFIFGYINKDTNRDSPFYGIQYAEQYEITNSELAGLNFLLGNRDELLDNSLLLVDFRSWDYLKHYLDSPRAGYWTAFELNTNNMVFSFRDVYLDHRSAFVGDSIDTFNFTVPNLNLIYDAGDFKWFDWHPRSEGPDS
ncbi:MAG: hypothetical protein JXB85_12605 [Anaerolineales bacterium]|nr:hypothetical protein [Anaerolineales bacterium]